MLSKLTMFAIKPQHAGTARTLKTADPTTVPTPRSPCVMNVPTQLMNNSEIEPAMAINVAPAMSSFRWKSIKLQHSVVTNIMYERNEVWKKTR